MFRIGADADERWLAGTSFPRWLESIIAHEALLYDAEGEFLPDAFEPDGEELTPTFALRQAERALRKDPDRRCTSTKRAPRFAAWTTSPSARAAFAAAAAADPSNPWPWFDLGRADHGLGRYGEAAAAFECAAEAAVGPEGARFCAWAARAFHLAGERATAERLRRAALTRDPRFDRIAAGRRAAPRPKIEDRESAQDAEELAALLGGEVPMARRLPVLRAPQRPRPGPAPPRCRPAARHARHTGHDAQGRGPGQGQPRQEAGQTAQAQAASRPR